MSNKIFEYNHILIFGKILGKSYFPLEKLFLISEVKFAHFSLSLAHSQQTSNPLLCIGLNDVSWFLVNMASALFSCRSRKVISKYNTQKEQWEAFSNLVLLLLLEFVV